MKLLGIVVRIEYLDHAWKYFCNESYLEIAARYHWQPVLLCSMNASSQLVDMCDALLLPGGYDIAAHYFKQTQHPLAHPYAKAMDHLDFAWINAFVKAQKPILGICRGIQLLNVYFGGTLCQHFDVLTHEESEHAHRILPCSNTTFSQLLTPNQLVNSYHHQCIDQVGQHLCVGAYSSDQRVEAILHEQLPILGVQWHPEKQDDDQILAYFFDVLART